MNQSRQDLPTGDRLATELPMPTLPELFALARTQAPAQPAIHHLGLTLSYEALDRLSDAFAALLVADGFRPGDRLALYMQSLPQFPLAALAAWKAGGIVVPLNPMHRAHELQRLLPDCRPAAVLAQEDLLPHLHDALRSWDGDAPRIYTTSARRLAGRDEPRVLPPSTTVQKELLDQLADVSGPAPRLALKPSDPAFIVYTSGTSGHPKGVINTHDNVVWSALTIQHWLKLDASDGPVLGIAPLFHITGIVGGMVLAWQLRQALVLTCRFHPGVVLEALSETRPAFSVGTITAYIALMNAPGSTRAHFASLRALISGGSATPPAVAEAFAAHSGIALQNGYGLTETSAGVTTVPLGVRAPVDTHSGALSVGLPVDGAEVWIADDQGQRLPAGEIGEIVIVGRSVSPGYWNRPVETAESMRADGFRSGDVGLMDPDGWVYLVDRKKDMINASGFKVWPREVEDVLYQHPAIREAAVVGVPDAYRGETVRAIVSLKPGTTLDPEGVIAWCRERIAPYKVPRDVFVQDELPKTPTGKILRRALRG